MAGEVIVANRGFYRHYGILGCDNQVIHFATPDGSFDKSRARIHTTSLDQFSAGDPCYIVSEDELRRRIAESQNQSDACKFWNAISFLIFGHPSEIRLYNSAETIQRASNMFFTQRSYFLPFNNCEHFAIWCKTGLWQSNQVNNAVNIVSTIFRLFTEPRGSFLK